MPTIATGSKSAAVAGGEICAEAEAATANTKAGKKQTHLFRSLTRRIFCAIHNDAKSANKQ